MSDHIQKGKKGEAMAAQILNQKGYHILDTNWRFGKEELDIICRDRNQLVVVEVKTRRSPKLQSPSDAVSVQKQRNIIKATNAYLVNKSISMEVRFDIFFISLEPSIQYEHIKDAFYPMVW